MLHVYEVKSLTHTEETVNGKKLYAKPLSR